MRASGWTDLPAWDMDDGSNYPDYQPPAIHYGINNQYTVTVAGQATTRYLNAQMTITYFWWDTPVPDFPSNAKAVVDAGGSWSGDYWPQFTMGGWPTDGPRPIPDPPVTIGPWVFTTGPGSPGGWGSGYQDGGRSGRYTFNDYHWLNFLDWMGQSLTYQRSQACGTLLLPSRMRLAEYWSKSPVLPSLDDTASDDAWSWVELNVESPTDTEPIVPTSVDLSLNIIASATRTSGTLVCYGAWVAKDGPTINDAWSDAAPGAPWAQLGSMGYGPGGGWQTMSLDIGALTPVTHGDYTGIDWYEIALTFRSPASQWVDPAINPVADDGPYDNTVAWSESRMLAHYPTGAIKYRLVGSEVYETGPVVDKRYFAILEDGRFNDQADRVFLATVQASSTPEIIDSIPWPYTIPAAPNTNIPMIEGSPWGNFVRSIGADGLPAGDDPITPTMARDASDATYASGRTLASLDGTGAHTTSVKIYCTFGPVSVVTSAYPYNSYYVYTRVRVRLNNQGGTWRALNFRAWRPDTGALVSYYGTINTVVMADGQWHDVVVSWNMMWYFFGGNELHITVECPFADTIDISECETYLINSATGADARGIAAIARPGGRAGNTINILLTGT